MSRSVHRLVLTAAVLLPALSALAASPESPAPQASSKQLFDNVERFWSQEIAALGGSYRATKLKVVSAPIPHACSLQVTVTGPFYCTADETVYLDAPFLDALTRGSKDPQWLVGFVVAHDVGHHVQNIIGTTAAMQQSRARSGPELAQRLFTTFELQADCYAGLWAHWAIAKGALRSPADVAPLLERVAKVTQGWQRHLVGGQQMLDPMALGTPEQRLDWYRRGLVSGRFNDCDTFAAQAAGKL